MVNCKLRDKATIFKEIREDLRFLEPEKDGFLSTVFSIDEEVSKSANTTESEYQAFKLGVSLGRNMEKLVSVRLYTQISSKLTEALKK